MPVLNALVIGDRRVSVDDEGYLVNMDDWDESVAIALAKQTGTAVLTQDKIAILKFIRSYYKTYNFFPMLSAVCKNIAKPRDCMTEEFYTPLIAWKLAGLPKPDEPVLSLLEAGQTPG